ncbi:hypothetical protein D3C73_1168800 [compost metagenome]
MAFVSMNVAQEAWSWLPPMVIPNAVHPLWLNPHVPTLQADTSAMCSVIVPPGVGPERYRGFTPGVLPNYAETTPFNRFE